MKLKSVFFVFVLLLLTVSVCAAQSPMGFSPDEFYTMFDSMNDSFVSVIDGFEVPDYIYYKGNEEEGAYIINSGTLGIYMLYSEDQVTELYLYYNYLSDDKEASDATFNMSLLTFATFWAVNQYKAGVDFDALDMTEEIKEIASNYIQILFTEKPSNYWGYCFEPKSVEENGYKEGVLYVTKAD